MPLALLGHRRTKSSTPSAVSTSSSSLNGSLRPPPSPIIVVNNDIPVQSILKPSTPRSTTFDSTTTNSSNSTHTRNRLSSSGRGGLGLPRSDTTDSRWSVDEGNSSTPGTSVSSINGMCPLPESSPANRFPFFTCTLSSMSTLSFIALPPSLRPPVLDAIRRAWRRGVKSTGGVEYAPELMEFHRSKGCDGGVWEVHLKDNCWLPRSEDKVS